MRGLLSGLSRPGVESSFIVAIPSTNQPPATALAPVRPRRRATGAATASSPWLRLRSEAERRPFPDRAFGPHPAAVAVDDPLHRGHAGDSRERTPGRNPAQGLLLLPDGRAKLFEKVFLHAQDCVGLAPATGNSQCHIVHDPPVVASLSCAHKQEAAPARRRGTGTPETPRRPLGLLVRRDRPPSLCVTTAGYSFRPRSSVRPGRGPTYRPRLGGSSATMEDFPSRVVPFGCIALATARISRTAASDMRESLTAIS